MWIKNTIFLNLISKKINYVDILNLNILLTYFVIIYLNSINNLNFF